MYVRLVSIDHGFPAIRLCIRGAGGALARLEHGDHYWRRVVGIRSDSIECGEFLLGIGNFTIDGLEGVHEDATLSIAWGMAVGRSGGGGACGCVRGERPGGGGGVGGHGRGVDDRGLLTRGGCCTLAGACESSKAEGVILAGVEEMAPGTSGGICREMFCVLLDVDSVAWACVVLSGTHRNRVDVWVEELLLRGWLWAAEDGGAAGVGVGVGVGRVCRVCTGGGAGSEMGA